MPDRNGVSAVQGTSRGRGDPWRHCVGSSPAERDLGKAIHRLMNRESPGGQIVFTPKFIAQNPRQLVAHLLCRDCEERIAKFGEAPALALINRGNTFPLLDRMKLATPSRLMLSYPMGCEPHRAWKMSTT
jgi:hypothetical protein